MSDDPNPSGRRSVGGTGLQVFPLALGGDVLGWTADERDSMDVLDAYRDAGGNLVDTADVYSAWADGHRGGESETVIGRWLARRGGRDRVVLASKVGIHPDLHGLRAPVVRRAVEASLRRLGTDHLDICYCHYDDPDTPVEETVQAMADLVTAGRIRHVGLSNYTPARLLEWLQASRHVPAATPVVLQPHYNLVERDAERRLIPLCREAGMAVMPYSALAGGFLTGKYRNGAAVDTRRGGGAARYLDDRGRRVLDGLDAISERHDTTPTAVAIAWLRDRPGVVAPISSARTTEQLAQVLAGATLELEAEDHEQLTAATDQA